MNIETEFKKTFRNKKVIITGHTGFKGSWMALWLSMLGAKIWGISLNNVSSPNMYSSLKFDNLYNDLRLDLTNLEKTSQIIRKIKPDFIFHLAAQPLVLDSIKKPINTIGSNTITTLNILETLKNVNFKTQCIFVTTDKVYENININRGYNENDKLGGKDIYSASKSMAEIAIKSYYFSFLKYKKNLRIAIGRPCNCIGGGDWSQNRLIPDIVKNWSKNKKVIIRNPNSIRPWQHVLEPVGGYLFLSYQLTKNAKLNSETFNFGPNYSNNLEVIKIVNKMSKDWEFNKFEIKKDRSDIEAGLLKINCLKAKKIIKWKPLWNINETLKYTNEWYLNYYKKKNTTTEITMDQIKNYQKLATKKWGRL